MKYNKDNVHLNAFEDHDGILTLRGGGPGRYWNGIHYKLSMKKTALLFLLHLTGFIFLYGQHTTTVNDKQQKAITSLIDQYSQAREKRDTVLLKTILTTDVDQLVSTGEWRAGINAAVEGMMKSSANSPGTRTLRLKKYKCHVHHPLLWIAGTKYKMQMALHGKCGAHLSLLLIRETWKIRAIRNMLPAPNN